MKTSSNLVPNPSATDPPAVERIDPSRVARSERIAPTAYPANPKCDRIELRDDPANEARDMARLATARAMNFVRSDAGKAAMRGAGDGYLDVVGEYMNSALAQRCNPIHMTAIAGELRGHDSHGNGLSIAGDADRTNISPTWRGKNEPNVRMRYDEFGRVLTQSRQRDGTYAMEHPFDGVGANYIMQYHGHLNTDQSMVL